MSPVISTGLSMPCSFCLLTHKRLVNLVPGHAPLLVSVSASIALFAIGTGPSHYAGDPFICRMRIYPARGGFIQHVADLSSTSQKRNDTDGSINTDSVYQ